MHPAVLLLNLIGLLVMYMAPLLGWYMLRGSRDRNSDLWFGAALVYAVGASMFVFQPLVGLRWASTGSLMASWITLTLFDVVLCRELGRPPRGWLRPGLGIAGWILCCQLVWELGGRSMLQPFSLAALAAFELYLLLQVRRLYLRSSSRGLVVLGLSFGLIVTVNFVRVVLFLLTGRPHDLLDFSGLSNVLMMTILGCVLSYSMGYWGYMYEKERRAKLVAAEEAARAAERQQVADEYAHQLEQLVQQRDRMVMVNSRFSVLNSLAVFNAGIVHEISQPLQSILTSVEVLAMELRALERTDLAAQADDIARLTLKVSHVLNALRRLMGASPPQTEPVALVDLLGDSLPIIVSECRYRGVHLDLDLPTSAGACKVAIHRVLMERVMLNLVSNAMESFQEAKTEQPHLRIGVREAQVQGRACVRITVQDNGPGLQDIPTDLFADPLHTSKPTGLGVGLQFVRAIVGGWRGQLDIESQTEGPQRGTCVTVVLPALRA